MPQETAVNDHNVAEAIELRDENIKCLLPDGNPVLMSKRKMRVQKYHIVKNYVFAILVRLAFIVQMTLSLSYTICVNHSNMELLSLSTFIVIVLFDGIYVVFRRQAIECYWFSLSIFSFTFFTNMTIWFMSMYKYKYESVDCRQFFCPMVYLSICQFLRLSIACYGIGNVLLKWYLPLHRRMTRTENSHLVIEFLTTSADQVEIMQALFDEHLLNNKTLLTTIIGLYSMSTLQFSFNSRARRRKQPNQLDNQLNRCIDVFFGTEIWHLVMSFVMHDMPFAIIRIVLLHRHPFRATAITYYFVMKNLLMCIMIWYRIVAILLEKRFERRHVNGLNSD